MKIVPDSNVWIGFFRNPAGRIAFESAYGRPLLYMSAVVVLELASGCRTRRHRDALDDLVKPFEKAGRILTPDLSTFRDAGLVLAKLGEDGIGTQHRRQLVNDVLIAVTAARNGAVVVTANSRDFALIARHSPVLWTPPS